MTAFRVTERSVSSSVLANLQTNLQQMSDIQNKLSSGKQLSVPSDSPTGTVSSLQLRGQIRLNEQYSRNASDGIGWLGTIDNTLTSALDSVRRLRDLTVQGMSTGSNSAEARQAMATEVDNIREELLSAANTTYLDRPIFGGTTSGSQAYDQTGAFVGDQNAVVRTVAANAKVRVDQDGPATFGSGTDTLFQIAADISNDLNNNPTALATDLGRLDTVRGSMQNALSDVGARYGRVQQMQQTTDNHVIDLKKSLSDVEDIDLPATIVDLQLRQVAYQAALGAAGRVVQPSLVDFLK